MFEHCVTIISTRDYRIANTLLGGVAGFDLRSLRGLECLLPSPSRSEMERMTKIQVLVNKSVPGSFRIIGREETCHVFSVGLGGGGGLLSVPDGLHLGEVGAVLVGEDGDN